MFWRKAKPVANEVIPETLPFTILLRWDAADIETVEKVMKASYSSLGGILSLMFSDGEQRHINVNRLQSWQSIDANPQDLKGVFSRVS